MISNNRFSLPISDYYQGGKRMEEKKVSKAQQKAVNKYVKNNYDRINVTIPKGKKAEIQKAAEAAGESVNNYIRSAIDMRMSSESAE